MGTRPGRRPTEFELEILKVLWERGPSTAREVLGLLGDRRDVGYTTVLKMLQLMEEKDMVRVDRGARSHVYAARLRRSTTLRGLASDFVERTFDGAAHELLVHLLQEGRLSADELDRLQEEIDVVRRQEGRS